MNEAELFAKHGVRAFAYDEKCACCGDDWGSHLGTACPVGSSRFKLASKLSSLTEPNCAEQEELWAAKCQPAHVSHVEPEREALPHFNQRTPYDSFKGWEPVRCVVELDEIRSGNYDHRHTSPLQRMTDQADALHGSAFLRG